MSMVRFASICDICGKRGEEYFAFPYCRECGRDLCPEHRNPDYGDGENNRGLCATGFGCQEDRNETLL